MQDEEEMWYWLTKMRLSKLGIDVGEQLPKSALDLAADQGQTNMFEFESDAHYKCDIVSYAVKAERRGECTEEILNALAAAWEGVPSEMIPEEHKKLRATLEY